MAASAAEYTWSAGLLRPFDRAAPGLLWAAGCARAGWACPGAGATAGEAAIPAMLAPAVLAGPLVATVLPDAEGAAAAMAAVAWKLEMEPWNCPAVPAGPTAGAATGAAPARKLLGAGAVCRAGAHFSPTAGFSSLQTKCLCCQFPRSAIECDY